MLYVSSGVRLGHRIPKACLRMQKELRPLYTGPNRVPRSSVSYAKVSCYHDNIIIVYDHCIVLKL